MARTIGQLRLHSSCFVAALLLAVLLGGRLCAGASSNETNNNQTTDRQQQQQQQQQTSKPNEIDRQQEASEYLVGVGIADITGPAADINLMGYAKPSQDSGGIHLRQFSRSIIVEDKRGARLIYNSIDGGMISQLLRMEVLKQLDQLYGRQLYNETNLIMTASHTHSGPGGFFQYMLYNIPSAGFISQTLEALVAGVMRSIGRAHDNMQPARIYYNQGDLLDVSINRSPTAYANNPADERAQYQHNTDKQMFLLRFEHLQGHPLAALSWFPVHATSMNNTNHLISSDNKGYASILFEEQINGKPPDAMPGQGPFVAIFAQSNEGDVSPNTAGPRCVDTGLPCELATSTCGNPPRSEKCISAGPGRDMFESTKIIAHKQFQKARELFHEARRLVRGPVSFIHENIDMTKQLVPVYNSVIELAKGKQTRLSSNLNGNPLASGSSNREQQNGNSNSRMSSGPAQVKTLETFIGPQQHQAHLPNNWIVSQLQSVGSMSPAESAPINWANEATHLFEPISLNWTYSTCNAALGYSFAAGTTDGPGAFDFQQGDTVSTRYWNMMRDFLRRPSEQLIKCQYPKPILLSTGEMDFPYMWHPRVVPTQIAMIGQVAIVSLPGEFTTMAGRRVREAVKVALVNSARESQADNVFSQREEATHMDPSRSTVTPEIQSDQLADSTATIKSRSVQYGTRIRGAQLRRIDGCSGAESGKNLSNLQIECVGESSSSTTRSKNNLSDIDDIQVVLSGLSNIYTSYITTLEEYEVQRYEGASTLYGPHTLQAYINQFVSLAVRLSRRQTANVDPLQPPNLVKHLFTLKPGVIYDGSPHGKTFGSLLADVDFNRFYRCREQVSAVFVAGNPRNNLRHEQSFLYVDQLDERTRSWRPVATDASWETKFFWERTNTLFGESRAVIQWDIPVDCRPGVYRIRHYGAYKSILQTVSEYEGQSSPFMVTNEPAEGQPPDEISPLGTQLQRLFALAEQMSQSAQQPNAARLPATWLPSANTKGAAVGATADQTGPSRRRGGQVVAPVKVVGGPMEPTRVRSSTPSAFTRFANYAPFRYISSLFHGLW